MVFLAGRLLCAQVPPEGNEGEYLEAMAKRSSAIPDGDVDYNKYLQTVSGRPSSKTPSGRVSVDLVRQVHAYAFCIHLCNIARRGCIPCSLHRRMPRGCCQVQGQAVACITTAGVHRVQMHHVLAA